MEPHARALHCEHASITNAGREHSDSSPAEALNDGHRAAATVPDARLAGQITQEAEDRAHVHADDRAAPVVIPASRSRSKAAT